MQKPCVLVVRSNLETLPCMTSILILARGVHPVGKIVLSFCSLHRNGSSEGSLGVVSPLLKDRVPKDRSTTQSGTALGEGGGGGPDTRGRFVNAGPSIHGHKQPIPHEP